MLLVSTSLLGGGPKQHTQCEAIWLTLCNRTRTLLANNIMKFFFHVNQKQKEWIQSLYVVQFSRKSTCAIAVYPLRRAFIITIVAKDGQYILVVVELKQSHECISISYFWYNNPKRWKTCRHRIEDDCGPGLQQFVVLIQNNLLYTAFSSLSPFP